MKTQRHIIKSKLSMLFFAGFRFGILETNKKYLKALQELKSERNKKVS